jgi:large subunit ribosomal protein L13
MTEIKYNAESKPLGRIASDVARTLMGKENVNYSPNLVNETIVVVQNIEKAKTDPKKSISKKYYSHSGYIGNLKERSMQELWDKDPQQFFVEMLRKMLPNNKLTTLRLKKVKFEK